MKRVLIIFPYFHHKSLVLGQCECFNNNGMYADALLMDKDRIVYYNQKNTKIPLKFRLCKYVYNFLQKHQNNRRFGKGNLMRQIAYQSIIKKYDIIELAGVYTRERFYIAKSAKSLGKKVFVRIWGTDFYGIQDFENDWHKQLFDLSDRIFLGTQKMANDFVSAYPSYKCKLKIQPYGLSQLEVLKKIINGELNKDASFLSNESIGKIIITIGYTGRTWQQHYYALDAIADLPLDIKEKIFVLVPMTYDAIPDYKLYIKKRLQAIGVPFQILETRLSLIQNLSMRIASDIAICIQLTDGLAASVQEHIMAGSVFIGGDWLPYKLFLEEGMYYRPSSLKKLSQNIKEVIENLQEEKEMCKNNIEKMYKFSSWKQKGNEILKLYEFE